MTTERETTAMTDLKPVWPDFIAPPKYDNPDPRWVDPALPDFRLIWKVARECGYAVGLHGSMKRDCDMIAVPWTDEAVLAFDLIDHLCTALNAKVVGPVAGKPHGRLGWNLQVDGYVKVIDISVVPRSQDRAAPDLQRIGTGLYETQSDYRLAPHLQSIVEAAKTAPQWDTVNDRMAPLPDTPDPAAHVNETPKSEHDAGNVLTDAAQAREAALPHCVGEAALEHMLDRKGIKHLLSQIKEEDPEVWREICEETGRAAIRAIGEART